MSLVLDCSLTATWFHPDETTDETKRILMSIAGNGAVVPGIWFAEIANVLQMSIKKRRIDEQQRTRAFEYLSKLDIEVDAETHQHAWGTVIALSDRHGLTAYDASYLELAIRRRLPLATLDKELRAAAEAEGVALLGM
jgi:predicted nucleic acid-binding protein